MLLDNSKVYQYFVNKYGIKKPSPKGWYTFDCPVCGEAKKRAVHIRLGITKCWKCTYRARVLEFVQYTENCTYTEAKLIIQDTTASNDLDFTLINEVVGVVNSKVSLPTGWKSILDGDTSLGERARNYLAGRGLDLHRLDQKGYGYCNKHSQGYPDGEGYNINDDYFGYIIIPVKKDGLLLYYLGRDYIGNYIRYKNVSGDDVIGKGDVIYNEEALWLYDEVGIVEGAIDAETWGDECTATLGWSWSPYQLGKYMSSSVKRYVLIPDAGVNTENVSFYKLAVKQAFRLLDAGKEVYVVNLNVPHLIKHGKDVNKIGAARVRREYENTEPLTWAKAINIISQK